MLNDHVDSGVRDLQEWRFQTSIFMLNSAIVIVRAVVSVYFHDSTLNRYSFVLSSGSAQWHEFRPPEEVPIAENSNTKKLPHMSQPKSYPFVTVGERTYWGSKPSPQTSPH